MTRPMETRLARLEATAAPATEAIVPPALAAALDRVAALKAADTLGRDASIADLWQAATGEVMDEGMAEALGIGPLPASPPTAEDAP